MPPAARASDAKQRRYTAVFPSDDLGQRVLNIEKNPVVSCIFGLHKPGHSFSRSKNTNLKLAFEPHRKQPNEQCHGFEFTYLSKKSENPERSYDIPATWDDFSGVLGSHKYLSSAYCLLYSHTIDTHANEKTTVLFSPSLVAFFALQHLSSLQQ